MPPAAIKSKYGKISKSYILTPPAPEAHSEVWATFTLTYSPSLVTVSPPKLFFKSLHFLCKRGGITGGQTDDDPLTRCPWRTFQAGGIKTLYLIDTSVSLVQGPYTSLKRFQSIKYNNAKRSIPANPTFVDNAHRDLQL